MNPIKLLYTAGALALLTPLSASGAEDVVKVYETREGTDRAPERKHKIKISNPHISLDIHYVTAQDGSSEGVGDPSVAQVSINHLFSAPALSFNVVGKKFSLARQPYTVEVIKDAPEKKSVRFVWDLPEGKVELMLVLNADDPFLYGRFQVEKAEGFQINTLLAPGGHCAAPEERDRAFYTVDTEEQGHGVAAVPLKPSGWLLLYDKLLDPEHSKGKGSVAFVWDEMPNASVQFQCGEYISTHSVIASQDDGLRGYAFVFWPFEGVPNEAAKEALRESGDEVLRKLSEGRETLFESTSNSAE